MKLSLRIRRHGGNGFLIGDDNMPRYVDAEQRPRGDFWESLSDKEKCVVLGFLLSLPTADVEEVRHGKLELKCIWMGHPEYECTACGERMFDCDRFEYCPYCGTKLTEILNDL